MKPAPVCDHSKESYRGILSCGPLCFSIFFKLKFGIFFSQFFAKIIIWKVTSFHALFLTALDMCTTNCSHFFHCESRQGFYYCTCQAGFSGPHCNINIDDCSSNLCVHGKCEDGINRFDCVCDKGYWGTNCEKEIISEEGRMRSWGYEVPAPRTLRFPVPDHSFVTPSSLF